MAKYRPYRRSDKQTPLLRLLLASPPRGYDQPPLHFNLLDRILGLGSGVIAESSISIRIFEKLATEVSSRRSRGRIGNR